MNHSSLAPRVALGVALAAIPSAAFAQAHLLVPGGPGGGWDTTARGVGEALVKSGVEPRVSFQNMSGGGGGKAIAYLIEAGTKRGEIFMVNSTPIVIRALSGRIPYSHHDLIPVASVVADFGAFVVRTDSPLKTWADAVEQYRRAPRTLTVAGGSARGSMDHLVLVHALEASGTEGIKVPYIPYDAGGKAKAGLSSGEVAMLSTGFSEALDLMNGGQARILAMTAPELAEGYETIPTLKSLGIDMTFTNWRGFFTSKEMAVDRVKAFSDKLKEMMKSESWAKIRKRNGWQDLFRDRAGFEKLLAEQEADMSRLLTRLGFIEEK